MSDRLSPRTVFHPAAAGALAFALLAAHPADAQATLSLSAPVTTASKGQPVTFTVLMNDTANNTGDYDFYVNLPTYLSFTPASFTFSPTSPFSAFPTFTITGRQMEVSAGAPLNQSVGPFTGTALGTFTALVNSVPATSTVTQITFDAQSVVEASGTLANQLTGTTPASLTLIPAATPEPSQAAALGLGVLGLCGLALRARRARWAC